MELLILIQTTSQIAPKFTKKLSFGAFRNRRFYKMEQEVNENFRSCNCDNCQCNVCLSLCMSCSKCCYYCCYECYRAEFAEEDWKDFYYPYNKDDRTHCFFSDIIIN